MAAAPPRGHGGVPEEGGEGVREPDMVLEEDFGSVNVVRVRGRGRLGLMVSPARRIDDKDVGLKVDSLAEEAERPDMDQEMLAGDVFLAINDVPLLTFPTETCLRLLELSSKCERRKLRIFRKGVVTERQVEHPGCRILHALGYPPDIRLVEVPEGRLGLVVSPARQRGRLPQDISTDIPEGWLKIERKIGGGGFGLPAELEPGDVIIRVNAIPLDDFDFSTSMRILQLATHRTLTIVKRQPEEEGAGALPPPITTPTPSRFDFYRYHPPPTTPTWTSILGGRRFWPPTAASVSAMPSPPSPGSVRGWHLVGKKLELVSLRYRYNRTTLEPLGAVGEAAA